MNATYAIETSQLGQFNKLVENANKKALKLGVPAYKVTVGSSYVVEGIVRGIARYTSMVNVTIDGSTPKFAGWKLVGVVSPLKTDGGDLAAIVTSVPGEHVSSQPRDPLVCNHCNVRRDRLESFLVQHEDGTERQVGRNCLTDFLGDVRMSPGGLASLMNTLASIESTVTGWTRAPRSFDSDSLSLVLATTIATIRKHGWVSVSAARSTGGLSTRSFVQDAVDMLVNKPEDNEDEALSNWRYMYRHVDADCLPTNDDFVKACLYRERLSIILDAKEEYGELEGNDYLKAVRIISYAGAVNHKAYGIACSIVALVDRETKTVTDPVKALLRAAEGSSKFVGQAKKREVFQGLTFIENFATGQGFSVATFVDPNGNIIKTFSHQTLLRGQKVNLKATVVRHDTYKGINQTVVNRPVVM